MRPWLVPYDAFGRLSRAQTGATVAQPASTVTSAYDLTGNRVSSFLTGVSSGFLVVATYDPLNRLTALTSSGTTSFTYDALGRRTSLTLPNGTRATSTYDAASQLTRLLSQGPGATPTTLSQFEYTYDATGNRSTRTALNGVSSYNYDGLNRLTQALQPDPIDPLRQVTEAFAYDPVGNRTASSRATGQVTDSANRLLEDSNFTYTYDTNGNLTTKTAKATGAITTYTYDAENRLTQVQTPSVTAVYRYDALGRRITKEVTQGGTTTITRYVYDSEDILVELDGTNTVVARYTHGLGIDEPLVTLRGGQSFFSHADGLGSVTALTTSTGTVAQSYTYDSFGNLLASPGTVAQPYTYTGREFDPETGLYYYRARYYDPASGRFLQEDPIGFMGRDVNFYTYVSNDPLNQVDPFGLQRGSAPPNPVPNQPTPRSGGRLIDYFRKIFDVEIAARLSKQIDDLTKEQEEKIPCGEKEDGFLCYQLSGPYPTNITVGRGIPLWDWKKQTCLYITLVGKKDCCIPPLPPPSPLPPLK